MLSVKEINRIRRPFSLEVSNTGFLEKLNEGDIAVITKAYVALDPGVYQHFSTQHARRMSCIYSSTFQAYAM